MQVGDRLPNKEISKRNSTGNASWGPTEADESQLTIMCKLGIGLNKEKLIPISTDNASRRGPNTEAVTNDKYYYIINH